MQNQESHHSLISQDLHFNMISVRFLCTLKYDCYFEWCYRKEGGILIKCQRGSKRKNLGRQGGNYGIHSQKRLYKKAP